MKTIVSDIVCVLFHTKTKFLAFAKAILIHPHDVPYGEEIIAQIASAQTDFQKDKMLSVLDDLAEFIQHQGG